MAKEAKKATGQSHGTRRTMGRLWTTLREKTRTYEALAYAAITLWLTLTILLAIARGNPV